MNVFTDFSVFQLISTVVLFVWTGFVRSGLGFGGAALGLPLLLFVHSEPVFWLPIIGLHLLVFSSLTFVTQLNKVDWLYLRRSSWVLVPFCILGVLGLISIPTPWMLVLIYGVSLFYAILWVFKLALHSRSKWMDRGLLAVGGYVAGASLTGAPLIVAVFLNNVSADRLRNTLFVLWFGIVLFKLMSYVVVGISLNLLNAGMLLPFAAIGHVLGLVAHRALSQRQNLFKQVAGGALIVISTLGLSHLLYGMV